MDSKFLTNGFVKKSPSNNRPKHIIFNGPIPQKLPKIDSKCHSPTGKSYSTKTKNLLEQRQALPVFNARQK